MDWSLYRCGRVGHITYAPDEPALRAQLHALTEGAELWQCLRCGTYVAGAPHGVGPVAKAPTVKRGKQIRGDFILKLFAIERAIRVVLFGALAYGIWRFANSRLTLTQAINRDIKVIQTIFKQLGFTINNGLIAEAQKLLHISPTKLTLIAFGVSGLAIVSGIEAFALWQAKRWGEYFAAAVTSLGLPLEIYELSHAITATKLTLFILNLILVAYLVISRRLFGARGGKRAYEDRLRSESIFDAATKAASGQQIPVPDTGLASQVGPADQASLATAAARIGSPAPSASLGPVGPPTTASPATLATPATKVSPATPAAPARPVGSADPTLPMTPPSPGHN